MRSGDRRIRSRLDRLEQTARTQSRTTRIEVIDLSPFTEAELLELRDLTCRAQDEHEDAEVIGRLTPEERQRLRELRSKVVR